MKNAWKITVVVALAAGCARVQVEAPKEPIKMDITMRLDVYQHVTRDIDAIESIVQGGAKKDLAWLFVATAYAAELDPEVEAAALRRRDRRADLGALLASGAVGENARGLLESRGGGGAIVDAENGDRMLIYRAIAAKNGSSVEDVQKLYAERLRSDAPAGSPVQDASGEWRRK